MNSQLSFSPVIDAITQHKGHWIIPLETAGKERFSFATVSEDGWTVGRHNQDLVTIESLAQAQFIAQKWIDKSGPEQELLTQERRTELRDIVIESLDIRYVMGALKLSVEGLKQHWQQFPYLVVPEKSFLLSQELVHIGEVC